MKFQGALRGKWAEALYVISFHSEVRMLGEVAGPAGPSSCSRGIVTFGTLLDLAWIVGAEAQLESGNS